MLGVDASRRRLTADYWCCTTMSEREYAYGPANDLPDTKVGTFSQSLMDEAKQRGWTVISMKNDWNRIFSSD
jgi:hypothetical protein